MSASISTLLVQMKEQLFEVGFLARDRQDSVAGQRFDQWIGFTDDDTGKQRAVEHGLLDARDAVELALRAERRRSAHACDAWRGVESLDASRSRVADPSG